MSPQNADSSRLLHKGLHDGSRATLAVEGAQLVAARQGLRLPIEEAQLRQRFPQIDISNIRKWKMIGEEGVWREYPTKEENPEKEDMITNTPTISIDEALEGRVAYDPYDIRQVLE